MKNVVLFFRITLGLILIILPICYFFNIIPELENTKDFKAFQIGLLPATYLTPFIRIVEFLCGLAFISKKYVTIANIIIFPVIVNILFEHYYLSSMVGFVIALLLFSGSIIIFYTYWKNYKHLLAKN
jgi:putative oxidoreductase